MNEQRKLASPLQALLILLLAAAATAFFFITRPDRQDGAVAVITVKGRVVKEVSLSAAEDELITLDNGVVIEYTDGKIGFKESGCPDKICIRTGMLSKVGESAACVPEGTVISIEGKAPDIDIISY